MKSPINIETPKGKIFTTAQGTLSFAFNTQFKPKWSHVMNKAQMFVDSEVLRRSEKYTPLRTGLLIKSGLLGTQFGSGLVMWIAPYAKARYYKPAKRDGQTLRGAFWFERMKAVEGKNIIKGAKKIAGKR